MVLAVRAILDLVDVYLAEGLRAVLEVANSWASQKVGLLGHRTTVLSYVEFLH